VYEISVATSGEISGDHAASPASVQREWEISVASQSFQWRNQREERVAVAQH
jgi:hypothetical protein